MIASSKRFGGCSHFPSEFGDFDICCDTRKTQDIIVTLCVRRTVPGTIVTIQQYNSPSYSEYLVLYMVLE